MPSRERRRGPATHRRGALDRGNALLRSPSWRASAEEYEAVLLVYTYLGDWKGRADVLCNLADLAVKPPHGLDLIGQ